MAHSLWPLFDLRIRSPRLELRLPTDDEIATLAAIAREGIHPSGEMPFGVAWSTVPSPKFEREFAKHHWDARASWSPDRWHLALAAFRDGEPIGAQSLLGRDFAVLRTVKTGSWLGFAHQGQGYGTEMRAAVVGFAFDGLGAEVAETEAFFDNTRSAGVSRRLGYADNGIGRLAPERVARDTQRFRMTREDWRSRPRGPVEIEGLAGCHDLFGVAEPPLADPA
ncbi:MAG: GNAT family N-acetyltransferase [Candidatus Limnocylindrales bacterium]